MYVYSASSDSQDSRSGIVFVIKAYSISTLEILSCAWAVVYIEMSFCVVSSGSLNYHNPKRHTDPSFC